MRDHLDPPGFRTRQVTLVTTRLAAAVSRVADLAELDRQRWQVETALAPLKTTMHMDVLHGKTVPGVPQVIVWFFFEGNDLYDDREFEAVMQLSPAVMAKGTGAEGMRAFHGWKVRSFSLGP